MRRGIETNGRQWMSRPEGVRGGTGATTGAHNGAAGRLYVANGPSVPAAQLVMDRTNLIERAASCPFVDLSKHSSIGFK